MANRNRTFDTLYSNSIDNNIMIAGDSHANWVSDLVWLDTHPYDPATGEGSVGVEFAGTAVSSPSPAGQDISIAEANIGSAALIRDNRELQWSELYYRGYFELQITTEQVTARYFGMPTLLNANPNEISLANFTVRSGENKLAREPLVGAGAVENGFLRGGEVVQTNLTNNTDTGEWFISQENQQVTLSDSEG